MVRIEVLLERHLLWNYCNFSFFTLLLHYRKLPPSVGFWTTVDGCDQTTLDRLNCQKKEKKELSKFVKQAISHHQDSPRNRELTKNWKFSSLFLITSGQTKISHHLTHFLQRVHNSITEQEKAICHVRKKEARFILGKKANGKIPFGLPDVYRVDKNWRRRKKELPKMLISQEAKKEKNAFSFGILALALFN